MTGTAITPRNEHFGFGESLPVHWHSNDPGISHFYDALSLTFPQGERFFVDSVRLFAGRIRDPALKRDVAGFMAQESVHAREHAAYNALLAKRGVPVPKLERFFETSLKFVRRHMPAKWQLAATCAYEHYTALFAEMVLAETGTFDGAHPFYRDLWRWHALEEQEHKAVAFAVYREIAPGLAGYLRRVTVMMLATIDFLILLPVLEAWILWHRRQLWNVRSWGRAFWHLWIKPGVWRHVIFGVASYLRPGFHPEQRAVPAVRLWQARYRPGGSGRSGPLFTET